MQVWPRLVQPGSLLASLALFIALAWAIGMRQRRAYRPADDGAFLGTTEFVFEPTHFEVTRAHSKSRNEWTLVRDVSQTATHVMLWIDHVSAYTFRVADLPSPLTVQDAVTRLRSFVVAARAAAGVTTPAVSSREASTSAPMLVGIAATPAPTIRQELGALLRLETHRSVQPAHLYGRDLTLLLLASLAFSLWVGSLTARLSGRRAVHVVRPSQHECVRGWRAAARLVVVAFQFTARADETHLAAGAGRSAGLHGRRVLCGEGRAPSESMASRCWLACGSHFSG